MFELIVLGLILVNGLFSMAEIALVSARQNRLTRRAANADKGAQAALELIRQPTRFLSTVQIGITTCSILSGIFGEAVLSEPLARELQAAGVSARTSVVVARIVVVTVVTFLSIIFGELVPKRLGQLNPEGTARAVVRPMSFLATASRPIVWLLSTATNLILKLAGIKSSAALITQEDIFDVLEKGSSAGAIEKDEQAMIHNVIRLDDRRLDSLMTPLTDILWLDRQLDAQENIRRVMASDYSELPLCDGGPGQIIGTLKAKDALYALMLKGDEHAPGGIDWPGSMPPVYVPETLGGLDLLERFKGGSGGIAFVIDEYGQWAGVITLKDLLEELTGYIPQGEKGGAVQLEQGIWKLSGSLAVENMRVLLGERLPQEPDPAYNTVAGMLQQYLDKIPKVGDELCIGDWNFTVKEMKGNRVISVIASKVR